MQTNLIYQITRTSAWNGERVICQFWQLPQSSPLASTVTSSLLLQSTEQEGGKRKRHCAMRAKLRFQEATLMMFLLLEDYLGHGEDFN